MNYLQIVQETAKLSGTVDPRSIATVQGASGRVGLLASLVQGAWQEIQTSYQAWRFLVANFPDTSVLAANVSRYTPATLNLTAPPWTNWILGGAGSVPLTIWAETPAAGATARGDEQALTVVDYPTFRATYQTGSSRETTGRPQVVAVDQQDGLVVWPTPTEGYRVAGTYRRSPQILSADDDEPIVAEEFHRMLAWAGKLLLDHHDEADGGVLLADMNLPMTFEASLASLRRRYLSGGLSIATRPLGPSGPPVGGINITGFGRPTTVGFNT